MVLPESSNYSVEMSQHDVQHSINNQHRLKFDHILLLHADHMPAATILSTGASIFTLQHSRHKKTFDHKTTKAHAVKMFTTFYKK